MLLWRICPRAESERAFEGIEVHASESRALAVLEYLAGAADGSPQDDLVLVAGEIPDQDVRAVPSTLLPGERTFLVHAKPTVPVHVVEPLQLDPRLRPRRAAPLPAIADGSERRLDRRLVRVQRIGGLIAVAVVAAVGLAGIGIAYFASDAARPHLLLALAAWTLLIGVLTTTAVSWPPLAWSRASFRVDGEGLRIRRGVWWREVLRIPRSRVQHTDVSQGPVERSFGLSTLIVHTAGAHHSAIQLEGLDLPTAEAVRDFLIAGSEDAV